MLTFIMYKKHICDINNINRNLAFEDMAMNIFFKG